MNILPPPSGTSRSGTALSGQATPSPRPLGNEQATNTVAPPKDSKAETMAADFEAIFIRKMLSTMRTASLSEGLFDGKGLEQFRDMQDSMLAETMAEQGVFGVADMLDRHVANQGDL